MVFEQFLQSMLIAANPQRNDSEGFGYRTVWSPLDGRRIDHQLHRRIADASARVVSVANANKPLAKAGRVPQCASLRGRESLDDMRLRKVSSDVQKVSRFVDRHAEVSQ